MFFSKGRKFFIFRREKALNITPERFTYKTIVIKIDICCFSITNIAKIIMILITIITIIIIIIIIIITTTAGSSSMGDIN